MALGFFGSDDLNSRISEIESRLLERDGEGDETKDLMVHVKIDRDWRRYIYYKMRRMDCNQVILIILVVLQMFFTIAANSNAASWFFRIVGVAK